MNSAGDDGVDELHDDVFELESGTWKRFCVEHLKTLHHDILTITTDN